MKWLIIICFWLASASAIGQEIEFTVHHAPGGPSDRATRLLAQELPAKQYVVVNRPGASGRIAVRHLLSRPSLMVATMPQIFVTNPIMFRDLEYDPALDLEVLAMVGVMPNLLICNSKLGFERFAQLRHSTKRLNFGVGGRGSNEHLATMALLSQWKNDHNIIYYAQGGSAAITDLMGGTIDCMFANYPLVRPLVNEGRLRPLLSSHELGLSVDTWNQVFKSAWPMNSELAVVIDRKMDPRIRQQIQTDLQQIFSSPSIDTKIRELGLLPILKMDARALADSARTQQHVRDFILNNRVQLKE